MDIQILSYNFIWGDFRLYQLPYILLIFLTPAVYCANQKIYRFLYLNKCANFIFLFITFVCLKIPIIQYLKIK